MDPSQVADVMGLRDEILAAVIRLPLAGALGAILALRPKRKGTPERQPAVVQTQIVLAIVAALIMLVIGASLARAFGIVGAANLIRYRSKIDDPKDAVVMLCALAVGLASGVGLYALGGVGTFFITACLWVIEGFEPQTRVFELRVSLGEKTPELRPQIEEILRQQRSQFELRSATDDTASYMVTTPRSVRTDRVSKTLMELAPGGHGSVEWDEKAKDKARK
jgi:uncharacterized membrane protein YhiD involved in acid resistance